MIGKYTYDMWMIDLINKTPFDVNKYILIVTKHLKILMKSLAQAHAIYTIRNFSIKVFIKTPFQNVHHCL